MATSFATYASQFLNRQQHGAASVSASQPMFFSFTTDGGSHGGHDLDADLDDLDDPHLRVSGASRGGHGIHGGPEDDDDPYLRLDEDERTGKAGFDSAYDNSQAAPLIPSDDESLSPGDSPKGWLAHLASPLMRHSRSRSRSPSPPPSRSSQDSEPPPDIFGRETIRMVPSPPPPPPPTSRAPISLSLTESLLPRDGRVRPLDVFSLPDPRHIPRRRRKYHDSIWTAIWCAGISLCVFFSILLLFVTHKPTKLPPITLPYTTLLHTVPMLTILTFSSAFAAYTHILLLRVFVRPVMIATSVFIPATLFISSIWAFVGSFMWDAHTEPTWGETVGLRIFSLVPLVLSVFTARRLLHLPRHIHTTSSTLALTTELLIANPFLLALSPAILLATLLTSIPFLTVIFRLLLSGHPVKESSAWEWHLYGWANWAITAAVGVWLWSWGVARGVLRMTCASVIGAWYFADPDAPPPPPMATHTIHSALLRSTGTSLGTVALSALILTIIRVLSLCTMFLQRLPLYLPARLFFLMTGIRWAVGYLESITTALSKYALVYAGLTGDAFMGSARRARALTSGVEAKAVKFGGKGVGGEAPLTLLTIAPLTLTFPYALTTYLFVAHSLDAPQQALGASVLSGGVTALVGLFCVGLIQDTADTLYLCYCIDKDVGERRREEVFSIFEYDTPSRNRGQRPAPNAPSQVTPPRRPQTTQAKQLLFQQEQQQQQQSQQRPRYPQPSKPQQPQYMPSESTSRFLPRQPLEPLSSNLHGDSEDEDDVGDPFVHQSRLEEGKGTGGKKVSVGESIRMMQTSSEMNMKSWTRERRDVEPDLEPEPEPYDVSNPGSPTYPASPRRLAAEEERERERAGKVPKASMESEDEEEGEGSQLFPGSGLF